MKINIIIPTTNLTGGNRVIFTYANYLQKKGHNVICYLPIKAYKFNGSFYDAFHCTIGNIFKKRIVIKFMKCIFLIKKIPFISNAFIRDADLVIATAWPTAFSVCNLNEKKGKKVYFVQGYEITMGKKDDVEKSYKLNLQKIVITQILKNKLLEQFGVQSIVVHNGLDENEFWKSGYSKNEKIRILMICCKEQIKGTIEGLQVLSRIFSNNSQKVEVVLFGAKKLDKIPNKFEFFENPNRETLINLFRSSDIYLFSSKFEAWGLPAQEAMANKCAVVGNNIGILEEIGIHGYNCLKTEGINFVEIEKHLLDLINNPQLLQKIKEAGYLTAQKFKREDVCRKFESTLLAIAEQKIK